MSLDIGEAFGEGLDRTTARNGLLVAVAFSVVLLVLAVLQQTFWIGFVEAFLEWLQSSSPQELGMSQQEYDQAVADFETQLELLREGAPFALGLPLGVVAAGFLVVALVAEAVAIVAVRVFGTDEAGRVEGEGLTDNLVVATLNGFVGKIVVYGTILLGGVVFIVPGIFFAVAFYFVRQEIALKDKNVVQAMADSWRLTRGHRLAVFGLGVGLLVVTFLAQLLGGFVGLASPIAAQFVTALLRGVAYAFGAAVATRAYLQLDAEPAPGAERDGEDPYDAALGPDDIPQ